MVEISKIQSTKSSNAIEGISTNEGKDKKQQVGVYFNFIGVIRLNENKRN